MNSVKESVTDLSRRDATCLKKYGHFKDSEMTLPAALVEQVRFGQAVLVLCTGACTDLSHSDLVRPPDSRALATILADKFLGDSYKHRALAEIADLAVSEAGLHDVQRFIADIYNKLEPSLIHENVTSFVWRAIATTHFDLALERAYDRATNPLQQCVPFTHNSESVDDRLSHAGSVMCLKLHGCISHLDDPAIPLILTPDQYPTHIRNRSLLFERLENLTTEHPLIIISGSLGEVDFRAIMQRLTTLSAARPRSYLVAGVFSPAEERMWDARKLTPIAMSPGEFFRALDLSVEPATRALGTLVTRDAAPIRRRFAVSPDRVMTDRLRSFLEQDVEFLGPGYPSGTYNAKEFYRGHLQDWSPIEHKLDVSRSLTDTLLSEVVLAEDDDSRPCLFHLIKGHAGSGKTVILRRLAWDSAIEFDKLCLYVRPNARLDYVPLAELASLCKQRLFLFVDQVTDHTIALKQIISNSRRDRLTITIVGTDRHHAWNTRGAPIAPFVQDTSEVRYLNEAEIENLISALERHGSLGYLTGKSREEQREALAKKAGRQLLVALHEATLGKPFSDIVLDEYNSISSSQAKSLYLTVCVLHRLGVQTRAGVISRVHGIPLNVFRDHFFSPLESIVFVRGDVKSYDYYYETRHPHIADIVFEGVLTDAQRRFDEYIRILNALDTGYNADQNAFRSLIQARDLGRLFPDPEMVRQLYAAVHKRYRDDVAALQQEAKFEMSLQGGRLDKAGELLRRARALAPFNRTISHAIAELTLRRSETARPVERLHLRNEARSLLRAQLANETGEASSYTHHSLLKMDLTELREMMSSPEVDEATMQRKIRDIEQSMSDALQRVPNDEYLLATEATFAQMINNEPRAISALKRAFVEHKSSPYVAMRLAKTYSAMGLEAQSHETLREYLDLVPQDKDVHFEYAVALMRNKENTRDEVLHHLRHSFTRGDTRYEAQFWCARALYMKGEINDAIEIFRELRGVVSNGRDIPRGTIPDTRFSGSIASVESSYLYVQRDGAGDRIYANASGGHRVPLHRLQPGNRVTFDLAFNLRGPIVLNLDVEAPKKERAASAPSSKSDTAAVSTQECDIGILIALKEEFREFLANVGQYATERDVELGHHYYLFEYPANSPNGLRCVATMIGEMGPEKAVLATERFITNKKPNLLVMLGIGAALHDDLQAGDVFVASQVDLYIESGKAEGPASEPYVLRSGGSVYRAPRDLIDSIRNFEFSARETFAVWQEKCARNWEAIADLATRKTLSEKTLVREAPALADCHLASGPIVGASTMFSEWLRRKDRLLKALDMEAGGAMVAAGERTEPRRMIVLRGISDYGDDRKADFDAIGGGLLRRYAMRNATELLWALVDSGTLEP